MKLTEHVAELGARVDGLSRQVQAHEKAAGAELPDGLHIPMCTSIAIDRYSGRLENKDLVRAYVQTLDAQQRFVQTIGKATVNVVAIPAGGEPVTVGHVVYDPVKLNEAYRSGWTGVFYTLDCPLTTDVPDDVKQLTLKVTLEDLRTGLTHEAEKTIPAK